MRENKKRAIPGLYTSIAVQVGVGSRGIQITTQLEKKVTQSASLRLSASQKEEEKGAVWFNDLTLLSSYLLWCLPFSKASNKIEWHEEMLNSRSRSILSTRGNKNPSSFRFNLNWEQRVQFEFNLRKNIL